jgi:hypothetical protein
MLRFPFFILMFAFISTFAFWPSHVSRACGLSVGANIKLPFSPKEMRKIETDTGNSPLCSRTALDPASSAICNALCAPTYTFDAKANGNKTTYSLSPITQEIFKQIWSKSSPQASADVAKMLTDKFKSIDQSHKLLQKQLDVAKGTLSANEAAQNNPAKDSMKLRYQSIKIIQGLPDLIARSEDSADDFNTQSALLKSLQKSKTSLPLSVDVGDAVRAADQGSNWSARGIWFGKPINSGLKLEYTENPTSLDAVFLVDKNGDNERLLCDQEGNANSFTKSSVPNHAQIGSQEVLTPQELSNNAKKGVSMFATKPPCANNGGGIQSDLQGTYKRVYKPGEGRGYQPAVTYMQYSAQGAKSVASFVAHSSFFDETPSNSVTWTCYGPSGILYVVTQYAQGSGEAKYTFNAVKKTNSGIIFLNDVDPMNQDSVNRYKQMQSLDPKVSPREIGDPSEYEMQKTQDSLPAAEPPIVWPTSPYG